MACFLNSTGLSKRSLDRAAAKSRIPPRPRRYAVPHFARAQCGLPARYPLAIAPELIAAALRVSGTRTQTAVVTKALQEFSARHRQERRLDLGGRREWDASCDYKAERKRQVNQALMRHTSIAAPEPPHPNPLPSGERGCAEDGERQGMFRAPLT
jgi:hypothetical protein